MGHNYISRNKRANGNGDDNMNLTLDIFVLIFCSIGDWRWYDQLPLYLNWAVSNPTHDEHYNCAFVKSGGHGYWETTACGFKFLFICEVQTELFMK